MNRRTFFSNLILAIFLTSCGVGATPMPTVTPTAQGIGISAAVVDLLEQEAYVRLTQQVIDNKRVETSARLTATQMVFDATATQASYEDNAKSTQRAEFATQAAWQVTVSAGKVQDEATQQAASAAAAQARLEITNTAQAQATATQMAVIALTATVEAKSTEIADEKTQEAPLVWAKQTAVYAESQKTQIELQKTQATMWVSAWGGWVFALVVLVVAVFVIWKKSQIGVISDENGRVRVIMINNRALQPDLMFGPVLDFSRKNVVTAPALGSSAELQRQIVHETKIVEAVRALPPGYQRQALGITAGLSPQQAGPQINIQVVQPERLGPVLDEVEGHLLDTD